MTSDDQYVVGVLNRHQSRSSILIANSVITALAGSINTWSNGYLHGVYPSGSIAKGTAISESSDVDILISVKDTTPGSLKDVYETLHTRLTTDGYAPRKQNVSLGITLSRWTTAYGRTRSKLGKKPTSTSTFNMLLIQVV